jgi:hypothetical protein
MVRLLHKSSKKELRVENRVHASLPVSIASDSFLTRDVSASGVFIEVNSSFNKGEQIDFVIEFDSPGGKLFLQCIGEVIRLERRNGKTGVAIKIVNSVMKS